MILKFIYSLFIGILLSLFIGLGIAAFYEQPKAPDYFSYPKSIYSQNTASSEAEMLQQEKQTQKINEDYQNKLQAYNKVVSIIAVVFAVIILIVSLTFLSKLQLISDGLLLGGVFTLIYSIIRGMEVQNSKFRFVIVAIGLIVSIAVGYMKFIRVKKGKE